MNVEPSPNVSDRGRRPAAPALLCLLALLTGSGPSLAAEHADSVNQAFRPLEWLVGQWQAEFRPHGDDLPAPTMSFEWGDDQRSYLRMAGTRPAPGGRLIPEYESMVVWHPVKERFVFLGVYRSGGGRVTEDGEVEILDDVSVRLHMSVHYPAGDQLPFSDDATAGPEGHTLEFQRTFSRAGADGLRGVFRIRRGDRWEDPHPGMAPEGGFPWRRLEVASSVASRRPEPPPVWVRDHWRRLAGTWIADNSAYHGDSEPAEAYGLDWSPGLGGMSLTGRLYGLAGGEEIGTYWQFREFWQPGTGELITQQFGSDGTYGVGSQRRRDDGSLEIEQTFYYATSGAVGRVGHRASLEGDNQTTMSFDIDESGEWKPRRTYVWQRQPSDDAAEPSGSDP